MKKVKLNLDVFTILELSLIAHEKDITLNDLITECLAESIEDDLFMKELYKNIKKANKKAKKDKKCRKKKKGK